MSANTVTPSQRGELVPFLLKSALVIQYLETLVERSLLIDEQTVSCVNALIEVKGTI